MRQENPRKMATNAQIIPKNRRTAAAELANQHFQQAEKIFEAAVLCSPDSQPTTINGAGNRKTRNPTATPTFASIAPILAWVFSNPDFASSMLFTSFSSNSFI